MRRKSKIIDWMDRDKFESLLDKLTPGESISFPYKYYREYQALGSWVRYYNEYNSYFQCKMSSRDHIITITRK